MHAKRIILGITGGIAAYKSIELCRRLQQEGAEIQVVMTPSAQAFVTPLTLQAICGNPVRTTLFDEAAEAAMGHIELARWAEQLVIAPASADFMARLAMGMANDLLSTLCLATPAPIILAPAMNQQMWRNPATQHNKHVLEERGIHLLGPAYGDQACGDVGPGRMLEPEEIVKQLSGIHQAHDNSEQILKGQSWLITAGPTCEALDPVRFLTNRSSGKMGYAIAQQAVNLGAKVTLVSGPVHLESPHNVERISVETADQMLNAVMSHVDKTDIFVACAAVSDYRPQNLQDQKIKKDNDELSLTLVKNPDILQTVSTLNDRPLCVGFAAETQQVEAYALDKLKRKNLDVICANQVGEKGTGFDANDNALTLLFKNGDKVSLEKTSKYHLAYQLITEISQRLAITSKK